jgi:HK97 gp10 family phage protein
MTKILGLDRLQRKLKRLPEAATTEIRAAMEKAAGEIVSMMKSLVAVDSGALRDSIGWTWGQAPKGSLTVASVTSAGGELTLTIYAGNSEAFYARWIEFGTNRHVNAGKFAGSQHPGTSAQPFFYVSWRANKRGTKRAVNKALRDSAKKVAAGG